MVGVGRTDATDSARHPSRRASRKTRLALAAVTAATVLLIAPSAASAVAGAPGEHRWADPVSSSHGNDEAMAVTTNAAGHAILAGDVLSSGGDYDISYRSYLADGTPRWDATWDGSGGIDWTAAVTVDKANNCVYVAGTTESPDGDTDYVILRVRDADSPGGSPGGGLIWKRTFNASHGKDEEAAGIARDKYGSVYVAGRSQRRDGSWDMHVVKYKRNGTRAWARRVNTGPGHYDEGAAIAVRGSSVFVAGVSENYNGISGHILLVRFSLGGSRKWVRYHDLTECHVGHGHRRDEQRHLHLRQRAQVLPETRHHAVQVRSGRSPQVGDLHLRQ